MSVGSDKLVCFSKLDCLDVSSEECLSYGSYVHKQHTQTHRKRYAKDVSSMDSQH